jgi:hypothetical protein
MTMQVPLQFGGDTICSTSDGLSGYRIPKHTHPMNDGAQVTVPNTAGALWIQTGKAGASGSGRMYAFDCMSIFVNDFALEAWRDVVTAAALDDVNGLRTLQYGNLNGGNTWSKANCKMTVREDDTGVLDGGAFWIRFLATFYQITPF